VYPAYPGDQGRPSRPQRPPLTKRLGTGHWIAIDCVVAALVTLIVVAIARQPQVVQTGPAFGPAQAVVSQRSAFPVVLLLAPGTFVPIGLRRRAPVLAFGVLVTLAAIVITADQNVRAVLLFLGAAYVLYTVTVESSRRTGVAALALGLGVMTLALVLNQQAETALNGGIFVPVAFAMVIAWIIGYSVRQRRLYILTLQHQAASSAVAEERLRIARELHDVVAHSMSVIAVQAGYGQYVIDARPEGAREALDAIQATSRDALDEMRRMLGVLRQQDSGGVAGAAGLGAVLASADAAAGVATPVGASDLRPDSRRVGIAAFGRRGDTAAVGRRADTARLGRGASAGSQDAPPANAPAPLAPAPGLADLGRLIERTSGAGITVSLEISGSARPVPASVDLSAYRIIQEALTNVVKHAAGGASCAVVVRYTDAELVVRVTDDGGEDLVLSPAGLAPKAAPVAGGGHGIIGMRERTVLCGGQFRAGPRPERGWQVNAVLPLRTPGTDGA
jgi:signal transduction histidine kinase